MMNESRRQQKFSKLIQKDLSDIFQRDAKHLFGNEFITITEVKMSPDLGLAKIYISLILAKDKLAMMEKINEHKSDIRGMLGNKIGKQVRIIPELAFNLDETLENAARINQILDGLDIPDKDSEED